MHTIIKTLGRTGLLSSDLDYHLVRASMVLIFIMNISAIVIRNRLKRKFQGSQF